MYISQVDIPTLESQGIFFVTMGFKFSSNFSHTARVINSNVPADKFGVILRRVLQWDDQNGSSLFTAAETEHMQSIFSLELADLRSVIDCCVYIYEQVI